MLKFVWGHLRINCFRLQRKEVDKTSIEHLENDILKRNAHLYEIEQILPKENGIYLKIILGNVNVSILNKEQKWVFTYYYVYIAGI